MSMDDEFGVSNKAAADVVVSKEGDSRKSEVVFGGGDELNSFPCKKKKMMMMVHDHDHGGGDGGGDGGGIGGPTCIYNSRPKTTTSDSSSSSDVIGGGDSAAAVKTLQPFEIGAAVPQTAFKSPGGFMATAAPAAAAASSMAFPFTNSQWKELERQAMIYKYMMASLPVPPQLLFPFVRNQSLSLPPPPLGGGLNLIRFTNGGDLEPGRCRRTDGKKWRCSRDVAPDQKYCERHLHRGRHRSRKPVELPPKNTNKKTCLESNHPPVITQPYNHVKSTEKVATFESLEQQSCLDWMMMKGEQWQGGSVYNQNLNCYSNFNGGRDSVFINQEDLVLSLDAWPNGVSDHHHHHNHNNNNNDKNSGNSTSTGNLSLSPLSLSMGGSTTIDDEMGQVQTGKEDPECSAKLPFSGWLSPTSWATSTPGGPLAEVLRPSTIIPSNPPSPAAINGDSSCSPATTTLSSPSGVLQKTLASWSDSSGSSSPTLTSSNANNKPVELALLWLNQGKLASST